MQNVTADPTAIEDILSGERKSANRGARIKHSTGKMIGITAAAAAVAICAGIGFSALNANDDSGIKSAATTSQNVSAITPAKQITQSFKLEATSMTAAPLGARTVPLSQRRTRKAERSSRNTAVRTSLKTAYGLAATNRHNVPKLSTPQASTTNGTMIAVWQR